MKSKNVSSFIEDGVQVVLITTLIVEISINFQKNISFISKITANFYIPFKSR